MKKNTLFKPISFSQKYSYSKRSIVLSKFDKRKQRKEVHNSVAEYFFFLQFKSSKCNLNMNSAHLSQHFVEPAEAEVTLARLWGFFLHCLETSRGWFFFPPLSSERVAQAQSESVC